MNTLEYTEPIPLSISILLKYIPKIAQKELSYNLNINFAPKLIRPS